MNLTRQESVLKAFEDIWSDLFSSPVHLDSALSKRPKHLKTLLAQIVPQILLRPVSLAESVGVGLPPGEPWALTSAQLRTWRPAALAAERIYTLMTQGGIKAPSNLDDFPPIMIQEWESSWGRQTALALAQILGTDAPLSLRASRKVGAVGLLKRLTSGNDLPVKTTLSDLSPNGVRLSGYTPILGTELYAEGAFEIQDEGSQVMAFFALWPELFSSLLQKVPGLAQTGVKLPILPEVPPAWNVVDACAGAGGKSLAFADALDGKGRIYSYDISETKLQALRRRAKRAGRNNLQAVVVCEGHESEVTSKFKSRAHRVLVDAPCSGWGVLRRNPDIKWRQTSDVLKRMPEIQLRLLSEYSTLVMSGGRLTFGVCTFRKAETLDVVAEFLNLHPDFEAREGGFLGPGPCDGFFMQSFLRKGGSSSSNE